MQTQGVETDQTPIGNNVGHFICKQAGDFDTLANAVDRATDAYVLANAAARLIDISLAGGGAGNVFMATLLMVPTDDSQPEERFSAMAIKWFQASDAATLQAKMQTYVGTLAASVALWAWETACAGDGAVWIAVLVTWVPGE